MSAKVTIELLPARHGDCLLLSYPAGGRMARILIDSGPNEGWDVLRPELIERVGNSTLDLFVITHVDADHIEGALRLMRDDQLGMKFADVWFNSYAHLESDKPDRDRGGLQGEFLSALLVGNSWNGAFDGDAVRLWDSGAPVVLDAGDGVEAFTILSPDKAKSRRMAKVWAKTCRTKNVPIGDTEQVLELLEDEARYDVDRGGDGKRTFGRDGSAANGSSIAFLFDVAGRRLLLTGDAHAEVLTASIKEVLEQNKAGTLRLDAFKLSHHGSCRNITPELLDLIDCDTFLVSTNGAKFKHPDEETIDLIASSAIERRRQKPTIWFNYRSETTTPYENDPRIVAKYGTDGVATIEL